MSGRVMDFPLKYWYCRLIRASISKQRLYQVNASSIIARFDFTSMPQATFNLENMVWASWQELVVKNKTDI